MYLVLPKEDFALFSIFFLYMYIYVCIYIYIYIYIYHLYFRLLLQSKIFLSSFFFEANFPKIIFLFIIDYYTFDRWKILLLFFVGLAIPYAELCIFFPGDNLVLWLLVHSLNLFFYYQTNIHNRLYSLLRWHLQSNFARKIDSVVKVERQMTEYAKNICDI